MECGSSCRSCLLSDVKDRLWILYSSRACVCSVTSAISLNAVENQIHIMGVKGVESILEAIHPRLISLTLWMNTVAWDLKHTF